MRSKDLRRYENQEMAMPLSYKGTNVLPPPNYHETALVMNGSMQSWGSTSNSTSVRSGPNGAGAASHATPIVIVDDETNEVSLGIIDAAFGMNSDLYNDILGISASANMTQIQDAYFERRNELFLLLAEIDNMEFNASAERRLGSTENDVVLRDQYRFDTERKLDAIVGAVRILRDPELRVQYDKLRKQRLLRKQKQQQQQQHSPHRQSPNQHLRNHLGSGAVNLSYNGTLPPQQHQRIVTPPGLKQPGLTVTNPPYSHQSRKITDQSGKRHPPPSVLRGGDGPTTNNISATLRPSLQDRPLPPSPNRGTKPIASPDDRRVKGASPAVTKGGGNGKRKTTPSKKGEAIVRDSNYVGALMRANALSSFPSPPQLPNYLVSTPTNDHHNIHNQDGSIVSGLTNPTALTGQYHNHYRRSSDYTTSTNGSSLEETAVSNSTMALNSYGPVLGPTDDDQTSIGTPPVPEKTKKPTTTSNIGTAAQQQQRKRTSTIPEKNVAVVSPVVSPTKLPQQHNQATLPSSTVAVQKSKLKSSEEQQKQRSTRGRLRLGRSRDVDNSIISNSSNHRHDDESTVSTYCNDDLNETGTYTEATFDNNSISMTTDYDDDDIDDMSLSESLVKQHEAVNDKNAGFLDRIRLEIMGAMDDTSRSFEQIFSAFTLRPNEIDAVAGRIDKAKRQMTKSIKLGGLPGLKSSASITSNSNNRINKKISTRPASVPHARSREYELNADERSGSKKRGGGGIVRSSSTADRRSGSNGRKAEIEYSSTTKNVSGASGGDLTRSSSTGRAIANAKIGGRSGAPPLRSRHSGHV